MTRVTCDLCGGTVATKSEEYRNNNVVLIFDGPTFSINYDLCISCGTRLNNKIRSFIEEVNGNAKDT